MPPKTLSNRQQLAEWFARNQLSSTFSVSVEFLPCDLPHHIHPPFEDSDSRASAQHDLVSMKDPLVALPYEIWSKCISLATQESPIGPLDLLSVSQHWQTLLIDCPFIWTRISISNTEDEMARISVFLYLSKTYPLYVDIGATLATQAGLYLLESHRSRIKLSGSDPFPTSLTLHPLHIGTNGSRQQPI